MIAIKSVDVCVKFVSNLTFTKRAPSIVPVDPKLQQEPQTAWSFTGVTAPITMKSKIVLICLVLHIKLLVAVLRLFSFLVPPKKKRYDFFIIIF